MLKKKKNNEKQQTTTAKNKLTKNKTKLAGFNDVDSQLIFSEQFLH